MVVSETVCWHRGRLPLCARYRCGYHTTADEGHASVRMEYALLIASRCARSVFLFFVFIICLFKCFSVVTPCVCKGLHTLLCMDLSHMSVVHKCVLMFNERHCMNVHDFINPFNMLCQLVFQLVCLIAILHVLVLPTHVHRVHTHSEHITMGHHINVIHHTPQHCNYTRWFD